MDFKEIQAYCAGIRTEMPYTEKGKLYQCLIHWVSGSQEVKEGRLPDREAVKKTVDYFVDLNDGKLDFLETVGSTRAGKWNRTRNKAYFGDMPGIWEDWDLCRKQLLTSKDMGYVKLIQSGEPSLVPDFVCLPEGDAGEKWTTGARTVLVTFKDKTGKPALRLGYDNEDVPTLLALKALQFAGYEMPTHIKQQMRDYAPKFASTGMDFYKEARRLTKLVRYKRGVELAPEGLSQFINKHPHFYDQATAEATYDSGTTPDIN